MKINYLCIIFILPITSFTIFLMINFSICKSLQAWSIVAIFYIVIVAICVLGQTAILIKKSVEYYKERKAQNMVQTNQPAKIGINNVHWNHQICNNFSLLLLIFFLLVAILSQYLWGFRWNHWMLSAWKNLTFEEKAHLYDNIEYVLLCVGIPLMIIFRKEKMRKHIANEIKNVLK